MNVRMHILAEYLVMLFLLISGNSYDRDTSLGAVRV